MWNKVASVCVWTRFMTWLWWCEIWQNRGHRCHRLGEICIWLIPWLLKMNPILEAHFPSTCWCPKFIIRFWEHVICYNLWRGFSDPAQVHTCVKDQIRNEVVQWSKHVPCKCVVVAETGICHAATDWLKMTSPCCINDMLRALIVNSANPSCAIFLKRFVSNWFKQWSSTLCSVCMNVLWWL